MIRNLIKLSYFARTALACAPFFSFIFSGCSVHDPSLGRLSIVETIAVSDSGLIEPFGIAVKDGQIYVSDGETGKVWQIANGAKPVVFAEGLQTPSAIAFDQTGALIVADTGSHTIKKIDASANISIIAGGENESGDAIGDALNARFNAPIGVAVRGDGSIIVADTYNDKIKLIQDGKVTILAGGTRGFADGIAAQFDTPCGVAVWPDGRIIVADSQNARLRVIEPHGSVWTLAGNGNSASVDGLLSNAGFFRPMAVAISPNGEIYIADGDTVRAIRGRTVPYVETISAKRRGFKDGFAHEAGFNRISGMAMDDKQDLIVADSDNGEVRKFIAKQDDPERSKVKPVEENLPVAPDTTKRTDPAEFRLRQPARWPYDPPAAKRDIAGTLGEIRGEIKDENSQVWFHNGLDIAGNYGETARFVRDEKVLRPVAAENFGTLRELIRLPTLGYIHIRLGRDSSNRPFGDKRFQFSPAMDDVRVPRGSVFKAGEAIGTLNPMNHVHLIAGRSGDEMNALDALILPGVADTTLPILEKVTLFDQTWNELETDQTNSRIKLTGRTRIVAKAYDRMDGNPERRRLGVFRLGYQILNADLSPASDLYWNINFDRNPDADAVKLAYAKGSHSGATGETIFNYIVTNTVNGGNFSEGFLDAATIGKGRFILRVSAADFFGNTATKDISIEVN